MKLIATLATLAALVGQTEAATATTAIKALHTQIGTERCNDKISLTAEVTDAAAATQSTAAVTADAINGKIVKFKLPDGFSLSTTFAKATHIEGVTYSASNTAATTSLETFDVATNTLTFTMPAAGAAGDDITLKLQALCNHMTTIDANGKYSWTAKSQKVKFQLETADTAIVESTDETVTSSAHPTALASFAVAAMPVEKSETGNFTATFTGDAGLNGKTLVLNLPEGYTIPAGAKCSIKKAADTTAKVITAASDAGLAAACTNTCKFSVAVPSAAGVGFMDTTVATFSCDKVTSGATVPEPATADVSIKAYGTANANDFAGYAKSKSASPTKSPTAKAADSPASVATASGVVVGALGVAALFLA